MYLNAVKEKISTAFKRELRPHYRYLFILIWTSPRSLILMLRNISLSQAIYLQYMTLSLSYQWTSGFFCLFILKRSGLFFYGVHFLRELLCKMKWIFRVIFFCVSFIFKRFLLSNWCGLNLACYLTASLRGPVLTLRRGRSRSLIRVISWGERKGPVAL